jgi:AraC-like DNA-binding protein
LLSYMDVNKPYRRSDLTLPELASELTMASHHLSQVINQHCQQNFFDFINTYRVKEIQQKLLTPQYGHLKIEEIAFESGFNSKSAFNAAFKKMTHLTPSQYRKARQVS